MSLQCYKCGKPLSDTFKVLVGRRDTCPSCMADIRVCRMCHFYDKKSYNDCREPAAERVVEKEKANFCDYFKIGSSGDDAEKQRQDALAKAAALFKK
ncbi:MAG TPA: hypothetical protein VNJ01_12605 [Bacteriovoracaceae bacterium]|nr:hypothetical protein [Bacteriovoracaceae bacterium]